MSEITKGPWRMTFSEDWIDVYGQKGVMANIRRNGPSSEAFAETAIALPDLLEALREARELLDKLHRFGLFPGSRPHMHDKIARIDAVLKKAGAP